MTSAERLYAVAADDYSMGVNKPDQVLALIEDGCSYELKQRGVSSFAF
jgi:hypothetical protein